MVIQEILEKSYGILSDAISNHFAITMVAQIVEKECTYMKNPIWQNAEIKALSFVKSSSGIPTELENQTMIPHLKVTSCISFWVYFTKYIQF